MDASGAYHELLARFREIALISSCSTLLGWDEETYMPPGGIEHRAQQIALLAGLRHQRLADPSLADLIAHAAELDVDAGSAIAANVREAKRLHHRHSRVPRSLIEEIAEITTMAQHAWATARSSQSSEQLLPWLDKILALKRSEAQSIGHEGEAYDVVLDEFEPGATTVQIAALLSSLARDVRPLLERILASKRPVPKEILRGSFPIAEQRSLALEAATAIGFDFSDGRLDTSPHPFSASIGPGDCRLTTRFIPDNFSEGFFCTLHEVGHGLYDQGIDKDAWAAPGSDSPSLGLHESQARLWENFVARSLGFWEHFFPRARSVFTPTLDRVSLEAFHGAVNHVALSPLRVRADMVTYDLHILVRFELERALFRGELDVSDLPGAWDAKYEEHLGLRAKSPRDGLLQDGHWAAGMFGYFPTYTLGNLVAAQLYRAAKREMGDLEADFAVGDFRPMLLWLRENVHRIGHRPVTEVVQGATGAPPSHHAFVEELTARLSPIYEL
jgi:carboxypeptidase Taq